MKIKATGANVAVMDVLRENVLYEFGAFIERIVLKRTQDKDSIKSALTMLRNEFARQCSIRKFNLLNTNVVVETTKTIFANVTLRSFYLELYGSLRMTLTLNYSEEDCNDILKALISTMMKAPVTYDHSERQERNHLNPTEKSFSDFCGQIHVKKPTIENFLEFNGWYYAVILVNVFSQQLIAALDALEEPQSAT